jgi:hypothetical protein
MEANALCEASLERIRQHHRDRQFVILTAWRKDRSHDDNVAALKGLKRQIRDAGYAFLQPLEDFTPASLGRFYGKLQLGMTFQGAWAGLKYADPPSGWIEGMGRESEGELFGYCETLDDLVQTLRRGPSRG